MTLRSSNQRTRFRRQLLKWFDGHARQLPWRRRKSLYRVWVSEIMLQQTQVVTVIGYYNRFLQAFPTVSKLAAAPEQSVLKLWEGLGYYRRARQLHAAARQIVEKHNGRFPTDFADVLSLPGVGRYTAAAILSIAANQRHPIVEANTTRLYSRLFDYRQDVQSGKGRNQLWEFAEILVSQYRPGDLNQALMELGSEICTASNPRCLLCPVKSFCRAWQNGQPESLPYKGTRKTEYQPLRQAAIVIRRGQRVVIRRCQADERWTNLWDFPRFDIASDQQTTQICKTVSKRTGLNIELDKQPFQTIKHAVTRYRITLECYTATSVTGRLRRQADETHWRNIDQLNELPMSVTGRKIASLLNG